MKSVHFIIVTLLLAGTAALVQLRGTTDRVPSSLPLAGFPVQIDDWSGTDISIDPATLEILGKGVFLNRVYAPPSRQAAPVGLFIGYFPTQRSGQSIHSPQNCLPGSGWTFESSGVTSLTMPDGKTAQVGEYIISNGVIRQDVLYWYRTHGRSIANDYAAKARMLLDSILYNRTDAALIRVITPIKDGEAQQEAHFRVVRFAEHMDPLLPAYVPD